MEIRDFAWRIVRSPDLADKVTPPEEELTDRHPGSPCPLAWPARGEGLEIRPGREAPVPDMRGMKDPHLRRRVLHALANHELQAAELYAWSLLAFPDAPADFRRDCLAILDDEQRHTRMYLARLGASGGRFGDFPVSGYFWNKVHHYTSPLRFACAMSLTFENANLDHTVDYAEAAREAGDEKTARVIDQVHRDEVEHVRFGWRWLSHWKAEDETHWEAFQRNLDWPLRPYRAKSHRSFHRQGREAAGLDPEFIRLLEEEQS